MIRLANVETSIEAIDAVMAKATRNSASKSTEAKRSQESNDRTVGGPVNWSQFYETTADRLFFRSTRSGTTFHTNSFLAKKSEFVVVDISPPQLDEISRANENTKERAEKEAAEFKNQIDKLTTRKRILEAEQCGLWCEVAFRAISHYDLHNKPLYRFEPKVDAADPNSKQHVEMIKSAADFVRMSLSIIDSAQKNQAKTFKSIKAIVKAAREKLDETLLRQGVDLLNKNTTAGKFAALAKILDDVANNLSDSFEVAIDGDKNQDQVRKYTFRGQFQQSLLKFAEIILALDEMVVVMKGEYNLKPDLDLPVALVASTVEDTKPDVGTPEIGGRYLLVNANSGRCLSVNKGAVVQGPVEDTVGPKEFWKVVRAGESIALLNASSGMALDVPNRTKAAGAQLITSTFHGAENQQWVFDKEGEHYNIRSQLSGFVMGVAFSAQTENAGVVQWPAEKVLDQLWQVKLLPKSSQPNQEQISALAMRQPQKISADAVRFDGKAMALMTEEATWHFAKQRCEMLGGHLAYAENDLDIAMIARLAAGRIVFLGASDEEVEGHWKWLDGRQWTPDKSIVDNWEGVEHYLAYDGPREHLNDHRGSFRACYICQWDEFDTVIDSNARGVNGSLPRPKDVTKFEKHEFALIKEPCTWHVAKRRCEMMGGHLAYPFPRRHGEVIAKVASGNKAWLGASDEEKEGVWKLLDGSPWKPEPKLIDNHDGIQHALLWDGIGLKRLDDNDACLRLFYVCQWDK